MSQRSVVINGDLGSGKSTVAGIVAEKLAVPRLSIGDLHRRIAQERGLSALDLNLRAEVDEEIDNYIDERQRQIAAESREPLVVDSRLGWLFFTSAFKVHLITDPDIAAQRVVSRPVSNVEAYSSPAQARAALRRRSASERLRFIRKYGADKARLRNYDVVIDTTRIDAGEAADRVIAAYNSATAGLQLLLDPRRLYPTESIFQLRGLRCPGAPLDAKIDAAGPESIEPISVGYTGTCFYVLDGHRRLSVALQNDFKLVPGILIAEFDEKITAGLSAAEYFESELTLSRMYDWEAAHRLELPLPPHLERQGRSAFAEQNGR